MTLRALYHCSSTGSVNNGLKESCDFEMEFDEGPHNCPLCSAELVRVPKGETISQILQRGQQQADQKQKKEGTKK
jgi:transcription initiation factor IIE alpha subunit